MDFRSFDILFNPSPFAMAVFEPFEMAQKITNGKIIKTNAAFDQLFAQSQQTDNPQTISELFSRILKSEFNWQEFKDRTTGNQVYKQQIHSDISAAIHEFSCWAIDDRTFIIAFEYHFKRDDSLLDAISRANHLLINEQCISDAIHQSLQIIGESTQYDVIRIFAFHSETSVEALMMSMLFEWSKRPKNEDVDLFKLHDLDPEQYFPSFYNQLKSCKSLFGRYDKASQNKIWLKTGQKVETFLIIPVIIEGECWGFMELLHFEAVEQDKTAGHSILQTVALSIGTALNRDKQRQALEQSRSELEISEEKYRLIAENTSDGILILNNEFRVIYASQSYFRMLQCEEITEPANLGNIFLNIIHPDDKATVLETLSSAVGEKQIHVSYSFRARISNNLEKWFEDNGVIRYDSLGNLHEIYVVSRDITERMLNSEMLTMSELRFRAITETANDGIIVSNGSGQIIFTNSKANEIFGFETNELLNKRIDTLIPLAEKKQHSNYFDKYVTTKISHIIRKPREFEALHKSGKLIPIEISLSSWEHLDEVFISANIRDISERKRSETIKKIQNGILQAISESADMESLMKTIQHELSTIIDTQNFYVAFYDGLNDRFTAPYCSDIYDDTLEWQASRSLTGKVVKDKKALLLRQEDINKLVINGEIDRIGSVAACWMGLPLLRKNEAIGAFVLQSYSDANAYTEKDMETMGFVSSQISIAIQRKKAMEEIQLLIKAVEQSPVSIVVTDPDGIIEYVNPRFSEVSGYQAHEAIGQHTRILRSGLQTSQVYAELWGNIKSGKTWTGELQNRKRDGALHWERVTISPIHDDSGKISHFVAIKEDVSVLKKMAEDLILSRQEAQAGILLKTAFMNNVSHEIRTPLNQLLGFVELYMDPGSTEDEKKEYYENVHISSDRLIQTITDYVDISEIASNTVKIHPEVVNFKEIVNKVLITIRNKYHKKEIHSFFEFGKGFSTPDDEHFETITDVALIRKVLIHLFDNAFKFTSKGQVRVVLEKTDNDFILHIHDNGIGIDPVKQKSIFDAFTQVDNTSTRVFDGSGLGLSIVKGFINKLKGEVWLKSEPGLGSTFSISLPIIGRKNEVRLAPPIAVLAKNPTLLLVEDELSNRQVVKAYFRKSAFNVIEANNGVEAIESCRKNPDISIVLMDLKLPLMDGFEATRIIKKEKPSLPVVAITAYAMSGDSQKAISAGCDEYLSKPLNQEILLQTISKYVLTGDKRN